MARLKIDKVDCTVEDDARVFAQVQLSLSGVAHAGRARNPIIDGSWRRAVAEATINAVRMFLDRHYTVTLDAVTEVTAGQHPLIVVTMTMDAGQGEVFLAGTSPMLDDRHTAVARAVLHGLNRQLETVLGQ